MAVAALASWHESHSEARTRAGGAQIPAHARLETYSVLTRLPPPHRLDAAVTAKLLQSWFPSQSIIVPRTRLSREIVDLCRSEGVAGGSVYDALVGLTAAEAGQTLVTRDGRALATYRKFGIDVEMMP